MNDKHYSRSVLRELNNLVELAARRESEARLREIGGLVNRWKKGSSPVAETLSAINRLSGPSPIVWSEGADPGVPAAHAVASGYLHKDDFSESAWRAIEILITLAEI